MATTSSITVRSGLAGGQRAGAADALLLAGLCVGAGVVKAAVLEDVALEEGQVLGVGGVAGVVLLLARHECVKAAVALAQVQRHDVGHEEHREHQTSLCAHAGKNVKSPEVYQYKQDNKTAETCTALWRASTAICVHVWGMRLARWPSKNGAAGTEQESHAEAGLTRLKNAAT